MNTTSVPCLLILLLSQAACTPPIQVASPTQASTATPTEALTPPPAAAPASQSTPTQTSASLNLPLIPVNQTPASQSPVQPSSPGATLASTAVTAPSPLTPYPASPTPDLSQMGRDSWLDLSPDGSWQAEVQVAFPALSGAETSETSIATEAAISAIPQYYTKLVLRHASGAPAWTVVDEWRDWGLGATTPQVFYWSPKNDFVLIADSATPDGCALFPYLSQLRRVDLATGEIQFWSADLQGVLAINPSGDTLIVFQNPDPSLRLVDVNASRQHIARAERRLSYSSLPGEWQAGGARWNPSGELMAFTAYPAACPPEATYIYTLDPISGAIELILDGAPGWLDLAEWSEAGLILGDRGGSRWLLDPLADALTPLP